MYTTDNRTETFLTAMGANYQYTNDVQYGDLSPGWKERNLARPMPVRENAVLEYASLMEAGSAAPAPILHKATGGHNVLDGVQRLVAGELRGYKHFSAYLVTCDSDDLLMAIRMLANARLQGHPEPPEWTRRQAVEMLVIQRGLSAAEVAAMGGWQESDVIRLAKVLDWGFKIRCIGGPTLPDNLVNTISEHVTQDELKRAPKPIAEFCNILKQARFSNDDAAPLVADFFQPIHKNSKRHETYQDRLADVVKQPEVQIRLHGRRGPRYELHAELSRRLKAAKTIAERIVNTRAETPYVDEYFRLLKAIKTSVQDMAPQHKRPQVAHTPADRWSTDAQS